MQSFSCEFFSQIRRETLVRPGNSVWQAKVIIIIYLQLKKLLLDNFFLTFTHIILQLSYRFTYHFLLFQ